MQFDVSNVCALKQKRSEISPSERFLNTTLVGETANF